MMSQTSPLNLALMLAGLVIWGAALNLLYGAQAVGCALGWNETALGPMSLQRAVLLGVWIAHLALHVWLLAWLWHRLPAVDDARPARFVHLTCLATATAGLFATAVTGALAAFLTPCSP